MSTTLARDDFGGPIQALRPAAGKAQQIAVSGTSARNSVALGAQVVTLYATGPLYFKSGDGAVTATASDHYMAAGERLHIALDNVAALGHTHIAAIAAGADCMLHISELE